MRAALFLILAALLPACSTINLNDMAQTICDTAENCYNDERFPSVAERMGTLPSNTRQSLPSWALDDGPMPGATGRQP